MVDTATEINRQVNATFLHSAIDLSLTGDSARARTFVCLHLVVASAQRAQAVGSIVCNEESWRCALMRWG